MAYSLWLIPSEINQKKYLSNLVKNLADKHLGPIFEPHLTILGDVQLELDELSEKVKRVAEKSPVVQLETSSVEYSTTYYQCIFVRVKPTPELMQLYDDLKDALELKKPSVFMPHISLFYGNLSYQERQEVVSSLQIDTQKFTSQTIVITPSGADVEPEKWDHLLELALSA